MGIEVTGRRGRRHRKLLDDLKERRGYSHLKDEALDRTMWELGLEPGAHPASYTLGTGSFPGVKCGRGVLLTTHPLLVPQSCKSRAIPLPTLWATPGL